VDQLVADARAEMDRIAAMGGAVAAIESGYMKSELVQAHAERRARVESGEQVIVGVNKHVESEPNPMLADLDSAIQAVDSAVAAQAVDGVVRWRAERDAGALSPHPWHALEWESRRGSGRMPCAESSESSERPRA
jgi:(2R)-ethylmalonyl-CoA mutase